MDKVTVTQADCELVDATTAAWVTNFVTDATCDQYIAATARIEATRQAEEQIKLLREALEPVASVEFLAPEECYADNDLVMVSVGTVRAIRQALDATNG